MIWIFRLVLAAAPFGVWMALAALNWDLGCLWLFFVVLLAVVWAAVSLAFRSFNEEVFVKDKRHVLQALGISLVWAAGAGSILLGGGRGARLGHFQTQGGVAENGMKGFRVGVSARIRDAGAYEVRLRYFTENGEPVYRYAGRGGRGLEVLGSRHEIRVDRAFSLFPRVRDVAVFVPWYEIDPATELTARIQVHAELLRSNKIADARRAAFFHGSDWYHFNEFTRKFIDLKDSLAGIEERMKNLKRERDGLVRERDGLERRREEAGGDGADGARELEGRIRDKDRQIRRYESDLEECARLARDCIATEEQLRDRMRDIRYTEEKGLLDDLKSRVMTIRELIREE